jgi:hypothetical protein
MSHGAGSNPAGVANLFASRRLGPLFSQPLSHTACALLCYEQHQLTILAFLDVGRESAEGIGRAPNFWLL